MYFKLCSVELHILNVKKILKKSKIYTGQSKFIKNNVLRN